MKAFVLFLFFAAASALWAEPVVSTFWLDGNSVTNEVLCEARLAEMQTNAVTDVYCRFGQAEKAENIRRFVLAAAKHGIRVSWFFEGKPSWIMPGDLGFDHAFWAYRRYQNQAKEGEALYAMRLGVDPTPDEALSEARKWQLYADFAVRAYVTANHQSYRLEWEAPPRADEIKVDYGHDTGVSLLEVLRKNSDGVAEFPGPETIIED